MLLRLLKNILIVFGIVTAMLISGFILVILPDIVIQATNNPLLAIITAIGGISIIIGILMTIFE